MRRIVFGCYLTACSFQAHVDDLAVDATTTGDGIDAPLCHGVLVPICLVKPADPGRVDLEGAIDTDSSSLCASLPEVDACVIPGGSIRVGLVTAVGSRPLVLLATTGPIEVRTRLDVASHVRVRTALDPNPPIPRAGAGANPSFCLSGALPGEMGQITGGGAGGSFQGLGGAGGTQLGGTVGSVLPRAFHGGCRGGDGITKTPTDPRSHGGAGGGAVALIAVRVEVSGEINASGASGNGGNDATNAAESNDAGGGGGSGGAIVFDTGDLVLTGSVFALGGGGGAGGGPQNQGTGDDGSDATAIAIGLGGQPRQAIAGAGGNAPADMGIGGGGSVASGGGGGGGPGFIWTRDPTLPAKATRPPLTN